jgi:hypothetical protein
MIPCFLWTILSIIIIPAYSGIGWYGPVFASVVGIFICLFILRSLWKRGRELRESFQIHIQFDDWIDSDESMQKSRDYHFFELKVAFAITLFLFMWSGICWYVEWYILTPAEAPGMGKPCERCNPDVCPQDPNCRAWADGMAEKHSILMICPTVSDGADTYVTFSCHADASWLTITGSISLFWVLTLLLKGLPLPKKRASMPALSTTVGSAEHKKEWDDA